jgi:HSP20 family protein
MTLVRWDPFRRVAALQDQINRLFEDSMAGTDESDEELNACTWRPPVDIFETEDGITFKAELAGIQKENISIEVKDNILSIKGERLSEPDIDPDLYYRKERCFGPFQRSFTLRHAINPDAIQAKYKDGILEIIIQKPEEERPKHIKIDIT